MNASARNPETKTNKNKQTMKVKVINLAHRTDRLEEMTKQLEMFGIKEYERFDAIPGGYMGFNASMKAALAGDGDLLLLEDDCLFSGTVDDLFAAIKELPEDFDLLYLGANVKSRQQRFSERLYYCNDAWTTHAIYYSAKGRKWCYENFEDGCTTIYDEWLNTIGKDHLKRFVVKPFLAIQSDNYSDIWGANVTYGIKGSEVNLK